MKHSGIKRYRFHFAKQDPSAIWKTNYSSHERGAMSMISGAINQKVISLDKRCQTLARDRRKEKDPRWDPSEQRKLVKSLTQIIEELPLQEKTIFSLHYCEGLNFKEIGEVLDCSELDALKLFRGSMKRVAAKMQLKMTN